MDPSQPPIPLRIRDLSFRYRIRKTPAIQGLSLDLHPGELMLVAGTSGCGKTTLIRAVNGLIPRSYRGELSGTVELFGEDVRHLTMAKLSQTVGTLLQDPERQVVRMLSISALFLIVPYTMNPRYYGVTFRGMGLPDRLAFSMDLAFRFVPTLARDFSTTLDAQRARGYEVEKLEGGLIAQIRKMAPLVVPVTMNAILSGEDITNAMDLRCFGTRARTWVHELTYRRRDAVLIGVSVLIFVASLVLRYGLNVGRFWVPDWALAWAGA